MLPNTCHRAHCECHQLIELIHAGILHSYVEVRTSVIFPSLLNKTPLAGNKLGKKQRRQIRSTTMTAIDKQTLAIDF